MLFRTERITPAVTLVLLRSGPLCGTKPHYQFSFLAPSPRTLLFVSAVAVLFVLLATLTSEALWYNDAVISAVQEDQSAVLQVGLRTFKAFLAFVCALPLTCCGFFVGSCLALATGCSDPGLLLPDVPPDGELATVARAAGMQTLNGIYSQHFDSDGSYRQACDAFRTSHCKRCSHYRPVKAGHCPLCQTCVLDFDHHCTLLGRCIGGRNLRYFLLMILTGSLTAVGVVLQCAAYLACRVRSHDAAWSACAAGPGATGSSDLLVLVALLIAVAVGGCGFFFLSGYVQSLCVPGAAPARVGFWRKYCGRGGASEASPASPAIGTVSIDPATGNPILSVPSWHPAYEAELKRWKAEQEEAANNDADGAADREKGQPLGWAARVNRYRERWLTLPWVHALLPRTPSTIAVWLRERPQAAWEAALTGKPLESSNGNGNSHDEGTHMLDVPSSPE